MSSNRGSQESHESTAVSTSPNVVMFSGANNMNAPNSNFNNVGGNQSNTYHIDKYVVISSQSEVERSGNLSLKRWLPGATGPGKVTLDTSILQGDIVIAVVGPTGSGKSTFIDIATEGDGKAVGHGLKSCTDNIRTVTHRHPRYGDVVFVDTPGFDDTRRSDTEILTMISKWLNDRYKDKVKLSGIIYMHRISDNRMAGSPHKNLRMFAALCGADACRIVVLATTMWNRVNPDVGRRREEELRQKYWKFMLDNGSHTHRFEGTHESAWEIVKGMVSTSRVDSLMIQEEMVDLGRRLAETQAGIVLYNAAQKLLAEQKETIRKLREEAEGQNNPKLAKELDAQYEKIRGELDKTFSEIEKLKVPIGRRLALFFNFKKTRSRAVNMPP